MKKILFLHGFTSAGQCDTAKVLAEELSDCATIVSPDLPLHPCEAISLVRSLCRSHCPDLIVSISCGTFYAQQVARLEGIPALLINPFFKMTDFLTPRIGMMKYINPRRDGNQDIDVTPELVDEFRKLEEHEFDFYDPYYRNRIWGLFGKHDTVAHYRDIFDKYYSVAAEYNGGHIIENENARSVLLPMVRKMLLSVPRDVQRYFRHFKGNYYKMLALARDSETAQRMVVYKAVGGEECWCRPEKMFFEQVDVDGKLQPRFKELSREQCMESVADESSQR